MVYDKTGRAVGMAVVRRAMGGNMLTRTRWTSGHCVKVLLSVVTFWSLAGVANVSLRRVISEIDSSHGLCQRSGCLPLPRQGGDLRVCIPWDFARTARAAEPAPEKRDPLDGEPLFDGKTLEGWKESEFAGQGSVDVADGKIVLGVGQDMTGITWAGGELPRTNYELELEAMRVDGVDFFCGLTFPVGDRPCSLIVGGWGGTIVGLSSIDRFDASTNETTKFMTFDRGKWYKIRLRVTPERIAAWIDDEQVVDFEIKTHKISIRVEVQASEPLGVASWQTSAALRNIRMRRLEEAAAHPSEGQVSPHE